MSEQTMSKAVLISIQPRWCELIASGKKTVEVRKTKPKLETPFKCYIYCTQGDALALPCLNNPHYTIHRMNNGTVNGRQMTAKEREQSDHSFMNGKVIGEFVCYKIETIGWISNPSKADWKDLFNEKTCLTNKETYEYTKGNLFYEWHITDLLIYDKPKELSKFQQCHKCKHNCVRTSQNVELCKYHRLTRPPQSWCYVEEIDR